MWFLLVVAAPEDCPDQPGQSCRNPVAMWWEHVSGATADRDITPEPTTGPTPEPDAKPED